MLKINSSRSIRANDNLQLVIPPIRACPNLDTSAETVGSTKEIGTKFGFGGGGGIVETDDEKGVTINDSILVNKCLRRQTVGVYALDDFEILGVVPRRLKLVAVLRPNFAVLCGKDTDCLAGDLDKNKDEDRFILN